MKHKLFSLLLAVVVSVGTMNAEIKNGTCGTNLTWSLNTEDSTLTISGTGAMSNYNLSNNPVPWKQDTALIKYLILEDGVTSIGSYAFYDCINLISVTIPNSVESIGNYAFQFCSDLPFVTIPQNVTSIGKQAFRGCSGLKWFACQAVTPPTLGSDVFYGVHRKTPMFVPSASIDEYKNAAWWSEFVNYISSWGDYGDNLMWYLNTIDSTLTIQGTGAMTDYTYSSSVPWYSYRSSIKSISLPDGLTTIGGRAFSGCSALTSIEIPNSVTSIGASAFEGCTGLTSVTIGNSVTSIGGYAFYGCSGLTSVTIPNSVTSIGDEAFYGCTGLTSVTIGNSVTSIGGEAFYGCTGLTSVTIPNSVTSIGGSAFSGCSGLTSVTIPNSVTSIGRSAFYGCTGLTSIIVENGNWVYDSRNNCNAIIETATNTLIVGCKNTIIPNSVTSIGYSAFEGCTGLTSVTIGNSVTSIGGYAFWGCTGLTSVTIPNSVTSIGSEAFSGCTGLTSVTIPNSVTSIGNYAFQYCSGLTGELVIPNSVISIGFRAFDGCTGLTSVTIPNSVTSIDEWAFNDCTGLENIYSYREQPSNAYSNSFDGVNKFKCTIHVLSASIDLYNAATGWSDFYYIQTIDAEKETEQITSVVVTPAENAAKIAWPINNGAATYTIDISKDGTLVCTLTFNANGQLTGIAFAAPSIRHDAAQETITGYSFTITSLTPGTTYNYSLVAKNAGGTAIDTKNGTFTTLAPTGIEDVLANPSAAKDGKVLHNGQIYILRDGKVYDLIGRKL